MYKAKLFVGLILTPNVNEIDIYNQLESVYGEIEQKSSLYDFSHTTYYLDEMGKQLRKQFIVIKPLISTFSAYEQKLKAVKLESLFLKNNKRSVNIDPGFLTAHNVILLTTKNYAHRIPLNKNIFAELTYVFKQKKFIVLPWSYPDFARDDYKNFFEELRKKYLKESDRLK